MIELNIEKIIDNYEFDEEQIKQKYNGDYKKLALDLAKNNLELGFKLLKFELKIQELENEISNK